MSMAKKNSAWRAKLRGLPTASKINKARVIECERRRPSDSIVKRPNLNGRERPVGNLESDVCCVQLFRPSDYKDLKCKVLDGEGKPIRLNLKSVSIRIL